MLEGDNREWLDDDLPAQETGFSLRAGMAKGTRTTEMTQGDIAAFGLGFVIGGWLMLIAYRKYRKSLASFWQKAYDKELKAHAETVEHHEATLQNVADCCSQRNLTLHVNGKAILPRSQEEWPDLIEVADQ